MLTQTFRHDPTAPGVRVWRRSRWGALGNALAIAFFVPLALSEAVLGIYMLATGVVMGVGVALFLWLCAAGIMQPLADEIMARASIPVSDFGMVEGGGGILAAWFLTVPDWSTPSVSVDRQRELWGRVDRTNRLARPRVYGD